MKLIIYPLNVFFTRMGSQKPPINWEKKLLIMLAKYIKGYLY